MKKFVFASAFTLIVAISPLNAERIQNACTVAAAVEYNQASFVLRQAPAELMTVEAMVSQRRLQEQYCLEYVKCILGEPETVRYQAAFSSCLREETLEQYDPVRR